MSRNKILLLYCVISVLAILAVPFINHIVSPKGGIIGFLISIAGLFGFFGCLKGKEGLHNDEVDWIYYFGFLITLFSLAAAAVDIGWLAYDGNLAEVSEHPLRVIIAFASGLLATGVSLILRVILIHEQNKQAPLLHDLAEAENQALYGVQRLVRELDTLMSAFGTLANQVKTSGSALVGSFNNAEVRLSEHFQTQLNNAASIHRHHEAALESAVQSFQQRLETLDRQFQTQWDRTLAAGQQQNTAQQEVFKTAADAFRQHLDDFKQSNHAWNSQVKDDMARRLNESATALGEAQKETAARYTGAVEQLSTQLAALKAELANITFAETAGHVAHFSEGLRKSLTEAAHAASSAGLEAASGIAVLHQTLGQVQQLSSRLAEHLQEINGVDALVGHISAAGAGLNALGKGAGDARQNLLSLAGTAQDLSASFEQSLIHPLKSSRFGPQTETAAAALAQVNQHLAVLSQEIANLHRSLAQNGPNLQRSIGDTDAAFSRFNQNGLAPLKAFEQLTQTLSETQAQFQILLTSGKSSGEALRQLTAGLHQTKAELDAGFTRKPGGADLETAIRQLNGDLAHLPQSLGTLPGLPAQLTKAPPQNPPGSSHHNLHPPGPVRRFFSASYVFLTTPISQLPALIFAKKDDAPAYKTPPRKR